MAQADGNIANQTGAGFRADLNNQLLALFTQHSGNGAPVTTYAFQPWIDTSASPPLWKIRNSANTAWITIGTLDATFSVGGVTSIANGGTGQTTAAAALTALLPSQTGNADKYLKTDGTAASWALAAAGLSMQVFTSTGSTTYTPTAGKTTFLVFCTGGGGGADSNSSMSYTISGTGYTVPTRYSIGGGGGGTAIRLYSSAEMGASASVTVGALGGASTTGGSSSFDPAGSGLTITGAGGVGAGAGGGTTNSMIPCNGQKGGQSSWVSGTSYPSVEGGSSFFAGGIGSGGGSTGGSSPGLVAAQNGGVVVLEW